MYTFYCNVELIHPGAKLPTRGTEQSAGIDFYTPINFSIGPNEDALIPLGIKLEFAIGWALILKEKSGIATKKKLDLGACVIDSDYRGEPHVHFFNNSDEFVSFKKGDKVCQGLFVPVALRNPVQVNKVEINTERGEGGFGSTGK